MYWLISLIFFLFKKVYHELKSLPFRSQKRLSNISETWSHFNFFLLQNITWHITKEYTRIIRKLFGIKATFDKWRKGDLSFRECILKIFKAATSFKIWQNSSFTKYTRGLLLSVIMSRFNNYAHAVWFNHFTSH